MVNAIESNRTTPSAAALASMDAALSHESHRWQSFYENRARPCPFFVTRPDESLVEWVGRGVIAPGRALDLGCGNGRNAVFLSKKGFSVEAVDYSQSAISWARDGVLLANADVQLIQCSVFEFTVSSATYDLVYDSGCFHHIPPHRRAEYISLVGNALKPGAWFGLTCFKPEGGSGYSDDEVYERHSMGGGLGYTEQRLRELWSERLRVHVVRTMHEQGEASEIFGKEFLWVLLAQRM